MRKKDSISSIFPAKGKTDNSPKTKASKLVGVHIDYDMHSYLSLYCLCYPNSKSSIIRERLSEWRREQELQINKETMITAITKRCQCIWDSRKIAVKNKVDEQGLEGIFTAFKLEVKADFTNRISSNHIQLILSNLKI